MMPPAMVASAADEGEVVGAVMAVSVGAVMAVSAVSDMVMLDM
jgi:hypothetical protein